MPVIRCSNEVYRLLQDKGLQDNEPVSIVLDRIVFLELKKPKPVAPKNPQRKPKRKSRAMPTPAPAPVAPPVANLWPWRGGVCEKCGERVQKAGMEAHEAKWCPSLTRGK